MASSGFAAFLERFVLKKAMTAGGGGTKIPFLVNYIISYGLDKHNDQLSSARLRNGGS